jgi:hypothetical protein
MIFSVLRRILSAIPPALSSRLHIAGLLSLGAWLVALPLVGIAHPSTYTQLIGGNYVNVVSALGAAIAAGTTVHVAKQQKNHGWDLSNLTDSLSNLTDSLMHLHQKQNRLAQQLGVATSGSQPPAPAAPAPTTGPAAAPPAAGTVPPPVSQP